MRIVICIPAQDMSHTSFWMSLFNMTFYTHNGTTRFVTLNQMNGCYLDKLRNDLVKSGLDMEWPDPDGKDMKKADYLLFIDSDMTFPKDTLARLIYHNKDVIGCNYPRRRPPFVPIAMSAEDYNKPVDPQTKGMTQVSVIPTGVLLIKPEVFTKIPFPWFESVWRKSDNKLIGEDVMFCAKLGDAKIPIFCDHDLSREVCHSGQMDWNFNMLTGS